jgi:hypothetical protein
MLDRASGTALWHRDGAVPLPLRWVLLRDPAAKRQPFALFCTDQDASVRQIIAWYGSRWEVEVTFEEMRAHLGFQTQRHWSTRAVGRTTPCLLGLFSVVIVLANHLHPTALSTRHAAWYTKAEPTFVDALAAVRRHFWAELNRPTPPPVAPVANSPTPSSAFLRLLIEAACYAA